ncbi:MAG: hypothetical protein AB1599_06910 [Planctomycetota bacterium]
MNMQLLFVLALLVGFVFLGVSCLSSSSGSDGQDHQKHSDHRGCH